MLCNICNKQIVLVPSAVERSRTFGGSPGDYTKLFTTHSTCFIKKKEADTLTLIRK